MTPQYYMEVMRLIEENTKTNTVYSVHFFKAKEIDCMSIYLFKKKTKKTLYFIVCVQYVLWVQVLYFVKKFMNYFCAAALPQQSILYMQTL